MNKKKIIILSSVIGLLAFLLIFLFIFLSKYKVNIIEENLMICYGEEYELKFEGYSEDLIWKSSHPDLIKVDEFGRVSFLTNKSSKVIISVESKFGFSDSIEIDAVERADVISVESVEIDDFTDIILKKGETYFIGSNIYPNDATNQAVSYVSSVPESVKIDSKGIITVLEENIDSVTISVITNEGNLTSFVNIKVNNNGSDEVIEESFNKPMSGEKIASLSFKEKTITINTGDYFSLQSLLKLNPFSVSYSNVKWSIHVSDDKLPSVLLDEKNGIVKGVRGGTATVFAKAIHNDNIMDKITINVKNHNKITGSILKVSGRKIVKEVNGKEMPVILKGINLGAWLSRSYSMSNFIPLNELAIRNNFYYQGEKENDSCINNLSFYGALSSNSSLKAKLENKFKNNVNSFVNKPGVNNKLSYNKISEIISESIRKDNLNKAEIIELSNILYDNFITEEDFDIIAQMGANVVRLPIEYSFFSKEKTIKESLSYIENIVNMAGERGIYVILDLHLVEGRQNSGGYCGTAKFYDKYDVAKDSKTVDLEFQKYMSELWGHIAYKFKDNVFVAGYELLNEPEGNLAKLVNYYNSAYKSIRRYDKNHIIIMDENCVVCGYTGASKNREDNNIGDLPEPSKTYADMVKEGKVKGWKLDAYISKDVKWNNVVYSTHDYTYKSGDQCEDSHNGDNIYLLLDRLKEKLINVNNKSKEFNVPYYVGEFSYYGTTSFRNNNEKAYKEYLQVWNIAMDLYEKYGLSYSPWTYKANNELYYGLVFYSTKYNSQKADLINDSYDTLKTKFSYKSYENMKFNEDFYSMFLNQFNSRRIVNSIKLDKTNISLNVGDRTFVKVTIGPNTAINKKIYWDLVDLDTSKNVISVDRETGLITAIGKGSATIIVGNYPFEKYIDSQDIYECSGSIPSNVSSVSMSNYSCNKRIDKNLSKSFFSTTVKLTVNVK